MIFISEPAPFLNWLQDECFYSLCSRQHLFLGSHSPEDTLNYLFGNGAKSFAHDFPKNLNFLSNEAKLVWGNADEIICEHTISPIFFPFQSPEHVCALKQAMKGRWLGSCKYRIGLVTGRFGGAHPLKACVECINADRLIHGSAYWHLSHQIPGVTTCTVHGILLLESKENRQWTRRFQWVLPDESTLISPDRVSTNHTSLKALQDMSSLAMELYKFGITGQFETRAVAQVYKGAFSNLGTSQKSCESAADCFAQYCSELQGYPPFSSLPCSRRCAIGFISQMTRKPRGYCHPLKHLTLISWLFGRLEPFVDAYQQLSQHEISVTGKKQKLCLLQTNEQQSPLDCAQSNTPRPKKIFHSMIEKILQALISGSSKKEVCLCFEISTSTINRILRLNPLIEKQITTNAYIRKRDEQRQEWMTVVRQRPDASTNIIKRSIPHIYAWLYRNDRSWLASQTSLLPSGRGGNHASVDWDARDEKLCTLIKQALIEPSSISKKILKRDLYQQIPSLFSSLEQKSHYAKARKLLSEIP